MLEFRHNKYFKFGLAGLAYVLWVIWVKNYWLLPGIAIVYDIYVSKKVNWSFWKKREGKNSVVIEWLDALIFAVIAVTFINIFFFQNYKIPTGSMEKSLLKGDHLFVSKITFGPRIPQTPLHFPFAQHTLPLTTQTKSYVEWIKWPYKRIAGWRKIKRNDVVVFNFPEGDTVVIQNQAQSYLSILRQFVEQFIENDINRGDSVKPRQFYYKKAREILWSQYDIVIRPVDRRDNYIKRCVGLPGDTLQIINTQLYVNGKPQEKIDEMQFKYAIRTDGSRLNPKALERIGIPPSDLMQTYTPDVYMCSLTNENVENLKKFPNIKNIERMVKPQGDYASYIFPHTLRYRWNEDNFGPLVIPQKGVTVQLTLDNLPIYERIINTYEGNDLKIMNGKIFINNKETDTYTFKMDYYFMMGDNRHDSADSRFWGFVPEDHIVGSPVFIWLSLDKEKGFPNNIRWKRMFKLVW